MIPCSSGIKRVIGFDPSQRNWGVSVGLLDLATMQVTIESVSVIQPVLNENKKARKNSLDLESAEQLTKGALAAAKDAHAIFVEVPVGSQSARAAVGYGVCVGVLGALNALGIQFFTVTAAEVKLVSGYGNKATKSEMIQWATTKHPEANWPMQVINGDRIPVAGKAEHMADAVGAIHAGIASEQFKPYLACL